MKLNFCTNCSKDKRQDSARFCDLEPNELYTRQSQREKVCYEIKKKIRVQKRGYMHNHSHTHTHTVVRFHFLSTGHSLHSECHFMHTFRSSPLHLNIILSSPIKSEESTTPQAMHLFLPFSPSFPPSRFIYLLFLRKYSDRLL